MDQETGLRVGLEDDLAPPPPPPPSGPPLHVAIIGALLGLGALVLLILSLIRSLGGAEGWQNYGWLCLAVVSGFGIFAVVQFVRLKSAKLLMIALTLGVVVNLMALIAMPLIIANLQDPARLWWNTIPMTRRIPACEIRPPEERLDTREPRCWASPSWWSTRSCRST